MAALVATSCGGGDIPDAAEEAHVIAFLRPVAQGSAGQELLLGELRAQGFIEGRNLEVLARDSEEAHPDPDDAAATVESWVDQGVDLIIASSSSGALIASETAPDLPVLFISNDPSAVGLIANEDQPEGDLTGVTFRVPADRTLDIARRALPRFRSVGFVYPAADPAAPPHRTAVLQAASELGIGVELAPFEDEQGVAAAIKSLEAADVDAIFLSNSPSAIVMLDQIQAAVRKAKLPLIANTDVAEDAIVILTPDTEELSRQLGRQVARLLGGSMVADVPVEDPAHFRVLFDLESADRLGFEIPTAVLREADEVRDG